jgi:hypothetical protein
MQLTLLIGQFNEVGRDSVRLAFLSDTSRNNGSGDRFKFIRLRRRNSGRETAKCKSNKEKIEKLHDVLNVRKGKGKSFSEVVLLACVMT